MWKTIQKHGGMVEGQKSLGCSTSQYFLWFHDYEPSYHIFCFIDRSGFIREISCFLIELVVSFRFPSFLVLVERHRCGVLKKWLCGVGYHKLPIYNNIVTLDIEKLKFAIAISTSIYTMHLFFFFPMWQSTCYYNTKYYDFCFRDLFFYFSTETIVYLFKLLSQCLSIAV